MANTIKLKRASGSDPSASDLVVGEVALRTDTAKLFTKKDDNSVAEIGGTTVADGSITYAKIQNVSATNRILGRDSSGAGVVEEITPANLRTMINVEDGATADQTKSDIDGLGIAASTAATLANARTIAGVSFDGSANISLNNNAITNGAGYITSTLTNEQVEDIVGGMLTGNTETGITVTYQDGDGTIDFVVGTLNQDTTGSAATLTTARNIGGVSFDGSANINLPGVNTSGNQNTSGNAATATKLAATKTIAGVAFDGSANISLNNNAITNGAGYITSADGGNAATLDGIDSASFVRSDASDTLTGATYTFDASTDEKIILSGATNPYIRFREGSTTKAYIQWNASGFFAFVNQESSEQLRIGSGSNGLIFLEGGSERTVYHTGNLSVGDGGLTENNFTDSDHSKLNGIATGATNVTNNNQLTNGAGYITSANGGNAATLDSLDSTEFLRSNTADSASGILSLSAGLSFGSDSRCAAGISALSDGSTITVNFTSGIHHSVTLGGNRTFGNPSNDGSAVGQCGSIFITQDGTGSRTASFHSDYKFAGGTAPTLSTAANAVDRLDYVIKASGVIHCVVTLDVK